MADGNESVKISFAGEDDGFAAETLKAVQEMNKITEAREASNRAERQRLSLLQEVRNLEQQQRKAAFDRLPLEQQVNALLQKREELQKRLKSGVVAKGSNAEAADQAALALTNFQLQERQAALAEQRQRSEQIVAREKQAQAASQLATQQAEQAKLNSLAQAQGAIARQTREAAFAELSPKKQLLALEEKRERLLRFIGQAGENDIRRAKLQLSLAQTQSAIERTRASIPTMGSRISGAIGSTAGQIFGGSLLTFAGYQVQRQIGKAISDAGRFQDLADRLRTDTSTAQGLSFAGGETNLSEEDSAVGIKALRLAQERALAGNKTFIASFERYGVTVEQLRAKKADQLFIDIARNISNGAGKTASMNDAMQLFGRSADKVIGSFVGGFAAAFDKINAAGGIIPPATIEALDEAGDKMKLLSTVMTAEFAPAVAAVIGFLLKTLPYLKAMGDETTVGRAARFFGAISGGANFNEAIAASRDTTSAAVDLDQNINAGIKSRRTVADDTEMATAERVKAINAQIAKLDNDMAFERLSIEEKITALKEKQAQLVVDANAGGLSEEEKRSLLLEQKILEKQIQSLESQAPGAANSGRVSTQTSDALQRIGGFRGGTPDRTPNLLQRSISIQEEQERRLRAIETNTRKVSYP